MVALSCLVVVPENTDSGHYICQPVLEPMKRANHRLGNLPEHDLGKGRFSESYACADELNSFHVGDSTNTWRCCQLLQRSLGTHRPSAWRLFRRRQAARSANGIGARSRGEGRLDRGSKRVAKDLADDEPGPRLLRVVRRWRRLLLWSSSKPRRSRRGSVTCWKTMTTAPCNSNWSNGRQPEASFLAQAACESSAGPWRAVASEGELG